MKRPSSEKQALLSGLRLGEVATIAGVPETTLQNWHRFGYLPTPPTKGKWRSYSAEHTEAAIHLAALVQVVGITPSRAAELLRERDQTLEEQGLGDLALLILRYTEESIRRARKLHAEKALEEQRALEEMKMRNVQRAIAELPSEGAKVSLLQDMVGSIAPQYVEPILLLAAGSLDEDAKLSFIHKFLCANRETYGRIIINSLLMLPPELRVKLSDVLSEGEEQKRQLALREICESFGLPPNPEALN